MEKIKIGETQNDSILEALGISDERLEEIVSHMRITYNSWNKQDGVNCAVLLQSCCKICSNTNESAYTAFHLGQVVCKIRYTERKKLSDPWDDTYFQTFGIAKDRSVILEANYINEAKKWGNSNDSSYTSLLNNCCLICSSISEIICVAFMVGFLKYKAEILTGEV